MPTAEMAVEAAIMEAEESGGEVDPRQLIAAVEQSAGLRIQLDQETLNRIQGDPYAFLRQIPDLVEASMGLRLWIGLIQTIERRIGESLGLEPKLARAVDWDKAEEELMGAFERIWGQRSERILQEVASDLEAALRKAERIDEALKIRLLVQMSYGQQTFFDKRTHQRRSVLVARRELEEPLQAYLRSNLGPEAFDEFAEAGSLGSLPEPAQESLIAALGGRLLTRAYRELFLSVADQLWVDYLTQMEALRTSIGLEAYGQRDPLVQYKSRAFDLFESLSTSIRAGVVSRMFRLRLSSPQAAAPAAPARPQPSEAAAAKGDGKPSGSGKKRKRRRRRK